MRLATIWSLPTMPTSERLRRTRDLGVWTLASKLPVRLRYFVTLGEIAKATHASPTHIPSVPIEEVLKNLDGPKH
jgi:hypothetical protein